MSAATDSRALTDAESEALFLKLVKCDKEHEVIALLRQAGYWDDDRAWRYYGDTESNYDQAGNQQRNPEAALVEKLVNSVDARLMRRCLLQGIDPESEKAPRTMREAVAVFYEGAAPESVRDYQGLLLDWTKTQRTETAQEMSVAITGPRAQDGGLPSITIADAGEGQAPERIPETILSLGRALKQRIRFVQGKWNMGGTGALRFCGARNLQLVLSKRDPVLAAREGASTAWGYTIVRRDDPEGQRIVSTYRYLAPVGCSDSPRKGALLTIERESLPIFPEGQDAYRREATWGTLVKLYEYDTKFKSHLFKKGGLQERLDLLIPGLALPVRLYECRDYEGGSGSFETTLSGLVARLNESTNMEEGFPDSGEISIAGEKIGLTIYAFKRGRASTYRRSEGLLFLVNGQTHAAIAARFFRKRHVGMGYLADSLLVLLDCSDLAFRTHEQLFMNSRDRLADGALAEQIEDEVGDLIRRHERLRALREQRRQEDMAAALGNAKPVETALLNILKRSPTFAALFLKGTRLSNPFSLAEVNVNEKFEGRSHPTIFKFKDRPYGETLVRNCHLGKRLRLTFETDVANDYFRRRANPGRLSVRAWLNDADVQLDYALNLHNGFAHLNLRLPTQCAVHDRLRIHIELADPTMVEPFVNEAHTTVLAEQVDGPHTGGPRKLRGEESQDGRKELRPAGIALPDVKEVHRGEWARLRMDEFSALRVVQADAADEEDGSPALYDFYINVDNIFLESEMKSSRTKAALLKDRFKYGMVLAGLGILRYKTQPARDGAEQPTETEEGTTPGADVEDLVAEATDALAPVLLPMIESLGQLELNGLTGDQEEEQDDLAEP